MNQPGRPKSGSGRRLESLGRTGAIDLLDFRKEAPDQRGHGPHRQSKARHGPDAAQVAVAGRLECQPGDVGGLQVLSGDGEWVTTHPIPGTFVVNVGDCLEQWTNRRLLSNHHRVVNSSGRYRQSIAVFVDPDFDTPIVPVVKEGETAQFAPTTCGERVMESFRKAYG